MTYDASSFDPEKLFGKYKTVLLQTELGGSPQLQYRFSLAGGLSSHSFGLIQFDIAERPDARQFLRGIGFNDAEIGLLSKRDKIPPAIRTDLDRRLANNAAAVDEFSATGAREQLNRLQSLIVDLKGRNPTVANQILAKEAVQIALMDYDNQFRIDGIGGGSAGPMLSWLRGATDVNLDTIWGRIQLTKEYRQKPESTTNRHSRLLTGLANAGVSTSGTVSYLPPSDDYYQESYRTAFFQGYDDFTEQTHIVYDVYNQYDEMIWQIDGYEFASYFDLPSGFINDQGNWFSWNESFITEAAGDMTADLFSSYGNTSTGDQLSFHVDLQHDGDWRVSLSASSESRYSSLRDRLEAVGQPHDMASNMAFFQRRAEELARDALIVMSVPIGADDLSMGAGDLTAHTDDGSLSELNSDAEKASGASAEHGFALAREYGRLLELPTFMPLGRQLTLETATAANALIESMAYWTTPAADLGAYADHTRKNQAHWSEFAPSSLSF